MKEYLKCGNPYMPLWEHVPDGEPRVFEYNGEKRVYVYGSHDTLRTEYCGPDQVVWSAPVTDLTDWTCHGVCYTATDGGILFAPDVVQKGDTFYLYAAESKGSKIMVAKSKNPAGPFTDPVLTELGFDPGILVDDDGRVYAFWGFCKSFCAELNDDMATIKPGTIHEHPLPHCSAPWSDDTDESHVDRINGFFEASSPRKIMGKYVYIYSKRCNTPHPQFGIYDFDCNGFLSYAYSDSPLEGYVYGGDISFNGGELIETYREERPTEMTYQWGNNHGSLAEVDGNWYIFYHRQTGTDEFSRQAMMEPVGVAVNSEGRIFIGDITFINGEPAKAKAVQMTSQGPYVYGLDARKIIPAGYACHIYGGAARAYVKPVYEQSPTVIAPVVNIHSGTTVGFRYLEFSRIPVSKVTIRVKALRDLSINVRVDNYRGMSIAYTKVKASDEVQELEVKLPLGIVDRHAIYFEFCAPGEGPAAEFEWFTFD